MGQWFAASAPAGASIAVVPIGAVAYYSKLEVRDMLGLTDRHIARRDPSGLGQGWAGHEKHDGQYILGRRPTYLLLGNVDVTEQPRDPRKRPFIPAVPQLLRAKTGVPPAVTAPGIWHLAKNSVAYPFLRSG